MESGLLWPLCAGQELRATHLSPLAPSPPLPCPSWDSSSPPTRSSSSSNTCLDRVRAALHSPTTQGRAGSDPHEMGLGQRAVLGPTPTQGGAYLGLADGAVEGIALGVVEQAEVQGAQGSCQQRRAWVTPRSGLPCRPPRGHRDLVPSAVIRRGFQQVERQGRRSSLLLPGLSSGPPARAERSSQCQLWTKPLKHSCCKAAPDATQLLVQVLATLLLMELR